MLALFLSTTLYESETMEHVPFLSNHLCSTLFEAVCKLHLCNKVISWVNVNKNLPYHNDLVSQVHWIPNQYYDITK